MPRACIIGLLLLASALPAGADEALKLGQQAVYCWNIPAKYNEKAVVTFDVTFDVSGGVTDIAVVDYDPSGGAGRDAVISASLAIEQCAPYQVIGPTTKRVRMEFLSEKPIDPFKN